jgi:hypothetical protein
MNKEKMTISEYKSSPLKNTYQQWQLTQEDTLEAKLRAGIEAGSIDVNIMAKLNRIRYDKNGEALDKEYADALSALRGYAQSKLKSSIIFSAGYNPMLYGYLENFPDFTQNGTILGAFGSNTSKAILEAGLNLQIKAPEPQVPSMVAALDKFLSEKSKKK